ncbi:ATP-binding protein [Mucilaginibacter agri]|uniref:histidine kinase n=1 Tax=Mucilaginibacter agri TaxID=2695265 RepID=A0A966DV23_9SPHI|nr:ATP-binding protein [Mucilaginibacter agri]NCD70134.1 PAS domain S-box protein [Mucilaginibacter agri]
MAITPSSPNEQERLAALQSYQILDTEAEKDYDDLTTLASAICQVPIALISFVDDERQWFKSHHGLAASETPVEQSFCAHAIASTHDIMIVEDAHKDDRFKDNPLVTGEPNITFYAGIPLVNEDGYSLGTLCVIDPKPKILSTQQLNALRIVAKQVMDKLELRRKLQTLEGANHSLKSSQQQITQLNTHLKFNDARTRSLIQQAPVAIIVFRGEDLFIEAVNPPMLTLLGKQGDILNKPLLEAIPELNGQEPYKLLYSVLKTGNPVYGYDTAVKLKRNGVEETGYYNFSYSPLIEDGEITGVIDMAVDVTEQVRVRKKIERTEESLRMAVDAADSGTYSMNTRTFEFYASPRLKELFGFNRDEDMSYEACMACIREDYRLTVQTLTEASLYQGERFELEYPVIGYHDGEERWLRGLGTVQPDSHGTDVFFTGIITDITERKEDDQRKSDFIGMVSHELKTPLTSMSGYVQMLLRIAGKDGHSAMIPILEKASKQVSKMTTMINGFLNVSRLESGKIHVDRQRFDIKDLIKEAEEESISTIATHRVIFKPVETSYVDADRDKIGQVISNFLSNAVKYSAPDTTIHVACITLDGYVQVSVTDSGMGINSRDIEKLFDRYYRVEGSEMVSISGFGIGLYLCAEIIKRHNGNIWVESEKDKGSTFYFNLPLA